MTPNNIHNPAQRNLGLTEAQPALARRQRETMHQILPDEPFPAHATALTLAHKQQRIGRQDIMRAHDAMHADALLAQRRKRLIGVQQRRQLRVRHEVRPRAVRHVLQVARVLRVRGPGARDARGQPHRQDRVEFVGVVHCGIHVAEVDGRRDGDDGCEWEARALVVPRDRVRAALRVWLGLPGDVVLDGPETQGQCDVAAAAVAHQGDFVA